MNSLSQARGLQKFSGHDPPTLPAVQTPRMTRATDRQTIAIGSVCRFALTKEERLTNGIQWRCVDVRFVKCRDTDIDTIFCQSDRFRDRMHTCSAKRCFKLPRRSNLIVSVFENSVSLKTDVRQTAKPLFVDF